MKTKNNLHYIYIFGLYLIQNTGKEVKADLVDALKVYRGNGGTAPLILNLGTKWR